MKSIFDGSTCPECNAKIKKNVEIEKNKNGVWSHAACLDDGGLTKGEQKTIESAKVDAPPPEPADMEEDPYKHCILGCVRAAEFFKSIDYPKELWNLSTIWNTERIKKK